MYKPDYYKTHQELQQAFPEIINEIHQELKKIQNVAEANTQLSAHNRNELADYNKKTLNEINELLDIFES